MRSGSLGRLEEEIEELVRQGSHKLAKARIEKLKRFGLSPKLRMRCSDWYLRMGFSNEAIKIVGAELLEPELETADVDSLKLQVRLAYMLSYFGADRSAERICQKLEPYLRKDRELAAQYYRMRGGNAMRMDRYREAAENYGKSLHYLDPAKDFYLYQMMSLGYADGLEGIGETEKAVEIAAHVLDSARSEHVILKAIAHQARGEYRLRAGDHEGARSDFKASWELFPKDISSRDYAFLAKWSGALECLTGNAEEAEKQLRLSLDLMTRGRLRPMNILEVLYWLVRLDPRRGFTDHWVLNTHPHLTPFSYLTGRRCPDEKGIHPWIAKQLPEARRDWDVWVLQNGTLRGSRYRKEVLEARPRTLDLVAGVWIGPEGKEILSPLKAKGLLSLASAGSLGISDWALIDSIYEEEWKTPSGLVQRLNDLVQNLRAKGYAIRRKQSQFLWDPPRSWTLLLPMDNRLRGIVCHLRILQSAFTRADLERAYGIKSATAKLWIKDWVSQGIVDSRKEGKSVLYRFRGPDEFSS